MISFGIKQSFKARCQFRRWLNINGEGRNALASAVGDHPKKTSMPLTETQKAWSFGYFLMRSDEEMRDDAFAFISVFVLESSFMISCYLNEFHPSFSPNPPSSPLPTAFFFLFLFQFVISS